MIIEVPIIINLSSDLTEEQSRKSIDCACEKICSIYRGTTVIDNTFLTMPFDKCVVSEGTGHFIKCAEEIDSSKIEDELKQWLDCILGLITSSMQVKKIECDQVTVTFSDKGLKYGWFCLIDYSSIGELYSFKIMPLRKDCFAEENPDDNILVLTLPGTIDYSHH